VEDKPQSFSLVRLIELPKAEIIEVTLNPIVVSLPHHQPQPFAVSTFWSVTSDHTAKSQGSKMGCGCQNGCKTMKCSCRITGNVYTEKCGCKGMCEGNTNPRIILLNHLWHPHYGSVTSDNTAKSQGSKMVCGCQNGCKTIKCSCRITGHVCTKECGFKGMCEGNANPRIILPNPLQHPHSGDQKYVVFSKTFLQICSKVKKFLNIICRNIGVGVCLIP